ncbi:MAG TPA: proline iminopeptidase-family hydrolase [Patescibacteria group bacterium]|nr:proline iminopeptidase-family hydrolase [Patescibacteria group bacterium]
MINEGFINAGKGKTWYEIVGKEGNTPIVTIHGGPAYPHDYLEPFEDLSNDRQIIFYDQLGCGNSEWIADKSTFTLEYYTEELTNLIKHLGLGKYIILGQSWGTAIGANFASTNPKGLASLILADPFLSTPLWVKDIHRIIEALPKKFQEKLKQPPESDQYKEAIGEFYTKYLYGMKELPTAVLKSEHKMNSEQYKYMYGEDEFNPDGPLAKMDITHKLEKINVPTILLCGRFDQTTPELTEYFTTLIPNSKMRIFENSAHFPFWTERDECMKVIREFIKEAN